MPEFNEDEIIESLKAEFVEETVYMLQECEEAFLKLEDPTQRKEELNKIFRVAHSIKGASAVIGLSDISGFAHILEDCLDIIRAHPHLLTHETVSVLLKACDALKNRIEMIRSRSTDAWDVTSLAADLARNTEEIRALAATEVGSAAASTAVGETEEHEDHARTAGTQAATVKVDALRIDSALDLVGELVVLKSQILQEYAEISAGNVRQIGLLNLFDKTVRELQERTLSMRLTALKPLFLKVQRVVRDVSDKLGKPVELKLSGDDIEIDRTMIELLNDPLVHLARNAMDHGVEKPERRLANGKPEKAVVSVTAKQSGGRVVIEITDDGGGIDRSRILAKAVEKGLIDPSINPETLSDEQVFLLLFAPGFSTAAEITDLSGRGVGLDVVKSNIEKMKGTIEVRSQLGHGSSFRISLPLTTAITDGIVVLIDGVRAIVPIESIRELIELDKGSCVQLSPGMTVADVRGRTMPIAKVSSLLGNLSANMKAETSEHGRARKNMMIAVMECASLTFAIVIDGVLGQSQVVVKPLGETFPSGIGLSGAAILGDGRVALVLDIDHFGKSLRSGHVETNAS